VGTAPKVGKAQITQFYRASMAGGAKLELAAPVRGSHGASAAMAFDVHLALPPGQGRGVIRVIDVMDFDREGKISSMRAFWGRDDMQLQPA
jgi:steroid delta-isomerase